MHKHVDWLIIGAGPAGLQLGYFLQKNNIDYLILERNKEAGSRFKRLPRHKRLTSINKTHTGTEDPRLNLRWDWHSLINDNKQLAFKNYSTQYFPARSSLVNYLNDFAKLSQLNIAYKKTVVKVNKAGRFEVRTEDGDIYLCNKLFIATGLAKPFVPNIPGIVFTRNYAELSLDTRSYEDKRVLIIGKGNSALETANHLLDAARYIHMVSPNSLRMAWRTHDTGDTRSANHAFVETCQMGMQNEVINAEISEIKYRDDIYKVTIESDNKNVEPEVREYDELITCAGFRFDDSIFADACKPKLNGDGRLVSLTPGYESVNIPDLYFIGALMQTDGERKNASGSIQGFRFNIEFLFNKVCAERLSRKMAGEHFDDDAESVAGRMIHRVNSTASLWQQSGYFVDVVVYSADKKTFDYYPSLPIDFVNELEILKNKHYFTVSLEFGQERIDHQEDVFAIDRIDKEDYQRAPHSTGLHPIIRHYFNRHLLTEHHIVENIEHEWKGAVHKDPLLDYLVKELAPVRMEQAIGDSQANNLSDNP